jgi:hypothetical protein
MKRVLIITYYWPPAGGPGVQRWLKFVTYFKEFGIEPIVYIPENPHYPIIDDNIVNEVPERIQILKHPIKEPYKFARLFSRSKTRELSRGLISDKKPSIVERTLLWIRGNLFIPDARIAWVKPSVKFLSNYLSKHNVDALITTGPPHSLHLIGMELKKSLNLPWIADFRDPWTGIHYHRDLKLSCSSERKHQQMESEVLNKADRVVVTSKGTRRSFKKITNKPIDVITNGFDEIEMPRQKLDNKFSLVHVGSLLSRRNPVILWEVIAEICSENSSFAQDLQIKLIGTVSEEIVHSINNLGLAEKYKLLGYVSHKEAIQFQRNAQLLLLIEMNTSETAIIIPGKLFEYLSSIRPIIALGPKGSDIESIISETETGHFFNYSEKERLKERLLSYYSEYKEGRLNIAPRDISKYSRRELTRSMSDTIIKVIK